MFQGHYFGELALLYDEPRNASVRATDEASLVSSRFLFFFYILEGPCFTKLPSTPERISSIDTLMALDLQNAEYKMNFFVGDLLAICVLAPIVNVVH